MVYEQFLIMEKKLNIVMKDVLATVLQQIEVILIVKLLKLFVDVFHIKAMRISFPVQLFKWWIVMKLPYLIC